MNEGADKALRDIVEAFFTRLKTEDALWVGVFGGISATTRNRYRDGFRANPCTLRLAFPRSEEPWPIVAFTLAADTPERDFEARTVGLTAGTGGGDATETFATILSQQVVCTCISSNNDESRILALLVLAAALQARDSMVAAGYDCLNPLGMQDLSPQESGLPTELWARVVSFQIMEKCEITISAAAQPIEGPVYCGIEGTDLGGGHTGRVTPVTELGG